MTAKPFTAPSHLWTAGTTEPALAAAAWAGWHAARGEMREAEKWEQIAVERLGRCTFRVGSWDQAIEIREIGQLDDLDAEFFDLQMPLFVKAMMRRLKPKRQVGPMTGEGI